MVALEGIHAAWRAHEGDLEPLLKRLRDCGLTRDEKDFIEARLLGKHTMRRGPKKSADTARRRQRLIVADAWLKYCEKLFCADNRIQILEGKTGLSATAIRNALSVPPDPATRVELDLIRSLAITGQSGMMQKPDILRET